MKQICSYCHLGIMACMCHTYQPTILSGITKAQADKLLNFFDSVGWISYDDWPEIHEFIKELDRFVEEN